MFFRRARLRAVIALVGCCLAVAAMSTPASAKAPSTVDRSGHASIHVDVAHNVAKFFDSATVRDQKTGQIHSLSAASGETCSAPPGESNWEGVTLSVNWTYDPSTGITNSTDSNWSGYVNCTGMVYMALGTFLEYNGLSPAAGTQPTCGNPQGTAQTCGYLTSPGSWSCTGDGACSGSYYALNELELILPAGESWSSYPSFCEGNGGPGLFCVDVSDNLTVPNSD